MKKDEVFKIDKNIIEPKWYEFNKNVKFKIRPFRYSGQIATEIMPLLIEQFTYCLHDWEGVFGKDGKTKLPVNDKNKTLLYDLYPQIKKFVLGKLYEIVGVDEEDSGN